MTALTATNNFDHV